jgi:hypothetical protein
MTTEEQDGKKGSNNPRPVKPEPSKEEQRDYTEIKKSHDDHPDWSSKQPLHEGYRPFEDTTNPTPPSDSGTGESE